MLLIADKKPWGGDNSEHSSIASWWLWGWQRSGI